MKLTSLLLLLPSFYLFLVLLKCNADDSSTDESEIFFQQTFQSEVCESADAPPLWRIGDTYLTDRTIIESYFGEVKVGHNDATGDHQSTLILKHVNLTLNGSVVSCWANSNLILNFTLVVVSIVTEHLAPNDSFRPPVCKSPLAESPQPNWMINGVILNDTTVNSRYNAHVDRSSHDTKGRHQAKLVIHSVNPALIQNGSNVSCTVDDELRMVFILYFTDPDEKRATPVTPGAESITHADEVVAGTNETSSSEDKDKAIVSVVVILIILSAAVVLIIILVVYIKTKGRPSIFKSGTEYKKTDNEGQRSVQHDGAEGPEEGEVHVDIVEGDGPGTRRAPRTPEEQQPLLRQRASRGDI